MTLNYPLTWPHPDSNQKAEEEMQIYCKQCGTLLTQPLNPIPPDIELSEADGTDYVPLGYAVFEDGSFWTQHRGCWCVNKKDVRNLAVTKRAERLNGCCDLDGCDGPNLVCAQCQSEVATAKWDCWIPHAVLFESDRIILSTENTQPDNE